MHLLKRVQVQEVNDPQFEFVCSDYLSHSLVVNLVCKALGKNGGGRGWMSIEEDKVATKQIKSCPEDASSIEQCVFSSCNPIYATTNFK